MKRLHARAASVVTGPDYPVDEDGATGDVLRRSGEAACGLRSHPTADRQPGDDGRRAQEGERVLRRKQCHQWS